MFPFYLQDKIQFCDNELNKNTYNQRGNDRGVYGVPDYPINFCDKAHKENQVPMNIQWLAKKNRWFGQFTL